MDNTITTMTDSKTVPTAQNMSRKDIASSLKDEERTRAEVWSRVMGYHRPISGWNIGKKQEFADRKYFKLKEE